MNENATSRVAYAMGRIGTLPSAFANLSLGTSPQRGLLAGELQELARFPRVW